ncbi:MAG TPA: amidohydrolase family protein [Thermoanaerobaculia bacterium]|nr:amidohydrolase family protein [Thermoanaerobaculia bacterium]
MRAILLSLLLALPAFAETIVFRNVNVISMTSPKVMEKQNVIVRDGKIESVSTRLAKMPDGTKVVDGTGKFLMPGLAEMHGHVPPAAAPNGATEDTLFLYVASGITTVRGMLGHEGQLALREKSKRGEIVAPNLYLAGPSFNGNSVNSPDEAIAKVRAQKKEGWDLLKVHPGLTLAEYDAMAKTAREEKIRFGGHVPQEVGLEHAIEMGQETFDHIDGYGELLEADKGPVDPKKLAAIVKKSKDAGVWIVPTSALWEVLFNTIPLETLKAYPELKYVPANAVNQWSTAYENRLKQMPREAARNIIENRTRILRALHEGGVRILMGTDAPQQFSVPGFSLHRELLRMREAGMSNYEILKSGTVNVGSYFAEPFGTVAAGQRADLVLLGANPLADIGNVAKIQGVMVRGRWLDRAALDARLAAIEKKHAR